MLNDQAKPIYYDGSGTIKVAKNSDLKTFVITPGSHEIPLIRNIEQKPNYYDGSGKLRA